MAMNMVNQQVSHRQFGMGTIISQSLTTVTVTFSATYGTKKFLYPSAFESFLELYNSSAKAEMDDELRQIRVCAEEEQRKRAEEEIEKRREKESQILLEQKHATTKKRSSAKKTPAKPKNKSKDAAPTKEGSNK